jgi:hypothetical protein
MGEIQRYNCHNTNTIFNTETYVKAEDHDKEIKALKKENEMLKGYYENCVCRDNQSAQFRIKSLESKLSIAEEALERLGDEFDLGWDIDEKATEFIYKTLKVIRSK